MNNEDERQYYEAVEAPFRESYERDQNDNYERYE